MENKRHETTNQKCPSLPSMDSSQYQPTPELIKKTPWKAQPCPALRQCQAEDIHDKQEKNSCPHHLLQRVCYPDGRETMRFTRFAYFPCRGCHHDDDDGDDDDDDDDDDDGDDDDDECEPTMP
jgi:hypothetical protein